MQEAYNAQNVFVTGESRHKRICYLVAMCQLVSVNFTLVRTDKEQHVVLSEEFVSDVGAEVSSGTPQSVGDAAFGALRVTPQNVEYLQASFFLNHVISLHFKHLFGLLGLIRNVGSHTTLM